MDNICHITDIPANIIQQQTSQTILFGERYGHAQASGRKKGKWGKINGNVQIEFESANQHTLVNLHVEWR